MDFRMDILGTDDFTKALKRLNSRQARNALARALNQATKPALDEARRLADANVGRNTGTGRKSIKRRTLKKQERDAMGLDQAVILYIGRPGFYLGFWEMGFTRQGVHYPARPFLRPAADSQQGAVVERFRERAKILIEKEAARRR